jgi:ABC-type transport system substrate-binding protein
VVVTGPQYVHSACCPKDVEPLKFDLERSKALLAGEGWADNDGDGVLENTIDGVPTEFRVTAMIPNNDEFKKMFEIFKEDLAKIGVQMSIEPLEWTSFVQKLNDRNFEVTALLWSTDGWDSDLYQIWHSSQIEEPESSNFISFSDPEVDRLIEQARETFDAESRIKVQQAAHRRINALQPYTFMTTIRMPTLYWPDGISDFSASVRWRSRPFSRIFPLFVPAN